MMPSSSIRFIKKWSALIAVIVLFVLIGHELKIYLPAVEAWISGLGFYAPLGFILLFVLLAPLFVSIDALCLAIGVLFPITTGELVIVVATYLAAALIFVLGRYLIREKVLYFLAKRKHFAALNTIISGDNAFKIMFLLRLMPLPFAMLSYGLSVTQAKFWPYLIASSGILLYNCSLVYLGYAGKHLSGVMAGAPSTTNFISHSLLAGGLFTLLVIIAYVTHVAKNTLKQLSGENSSLISD